MDKIPGADRLAKEPKLLIGLCRNVVERLEDSVDNVEIPVLEAQLREISNTIVRLKKLGVAVPPALRTEKHRLSSLLNSKAEGYDSLVYLAYEFEGILQDLRFRMGGQPEKPLKAKNRPHSASVDKNDREILREYMMIALENLGGRARVTSVLEEMTRLLKKKMLPGNLELYQDGKKISWTAQPQDNGIAQLAGKRAGYDDLPLDVWEFEEKSIRKHIG
ncbi:hypothetical protein [Desulfonatronovibrio hydrogenovorans]|uniref:hypothetical protein n=1 Tax=Desulfonatronovibrio hydrogenovorans TaxID=53245 RepID=UPI000491E408|nr:hypothetical protein [Desulfonatronovibrio hydrogenovorans]